MNRLGSKKTFVVTGGLGFIGSHFIERILALGHTVINIDKMTYAANLGLKFTGDYTFKQQDIAQLDDLSYCDIIVNFAAESHVDNSINASDNFITTNVLGVHNLLEIIKRHKISNMQTSWGYRPPLFVQISTDEVFGDILQGAFSECDRHMPSNPYAATKSCAEQLTCAWGRTYDLPYIITRTTNNYGCRQHPEKLIPAVITRLRDGKKVIVHGGGHYIRNWIHVEDNVDAIIRIIDTGRESAAYHVSSDEEYSVRQIVDKIATHMGKWYDDVVDTSTDRSGCDVRYALNHAQLTADTGWVQTRRFDNELVKIIDHYTKACT